MKKISERFIPCISRRHFLVSGKTSYDSRVLWGGLEKTEHPNGNFQIQFSTFISTSNTFMRLHNLSILIGQPIVWLDCTSWPKKVIRQLVTLTTNGRLIGFTSYRWLVSYISHGSSSSQGTRFYGIQKPLVAPSLRLCATIQGLWLSKICRTLCFDVLTQDLTITQMV